MKARKRLAQLAGIGIVCLSPALVGTASAAASLVLGSEGAVVPVGTPVRAVLGFGPCGSFEGEGTLTVNQAATDVAKFTSTKGSAGGCGEGGPTISGFILGDKLTETGHFNLTVNMTYTTHLNRECAYHLHMLGGKFAIPGLTKATLKGVAKRLATTSPECEEKIKITGAEGALYDAGAGTLLEAEL